MALEVVFEYCPQSPSWPQLPKVSVYESMMYQYLEGIPGWVWKDDNIFFSEPEEINDLENALVDIELKKLERFAITEKYSLTFNKFIEKLKNKSEVEIVKGQVIGPITFLSSHKKESGNLLISDEFYKEIISKILKLKADYQVMSFNSVNPKSNKIIFFDEPVLSQIGSAVLNLKKEDIVSIYESITSSDLYYYTGMHICGNSEWDFIMSLPINIINFDAYNYYEEFFIYKRDIKKFIEKGGYIAFGIIPTESNLIKEIKFAEILERKDFVEKKLNEFLDNDLVKERVFYTPSCGMGTLTEEEMYKVLNFLTEIKKGL